MWKGKKCFVIGGAGFIDSHLVKTLIRKGAQVRVIGNLEKGCVEGTMSNLCKGETIKKLMTDLRLKDTSNV